jgi:hypothetical protein
MINSVVVNVLHLSPSPLDRATFLDKTIESLERNGVNCDVAIVPGDIGSRSPVDYARFLPQVTKRRLANEYDLIHSHDGLTAPAALSQVGIPKVASLWGTDVFDDWKRLLSQSVYFADETIVTSEEMADLLYRDCRVIPHGVDMDLFTVHDTTLSKDNLNWSSDAKHALFPYNPERPEKRYNLAKRAVAEAENEYGESIELKTVYGESYERIPEYMNAADVLLITSEYEGGPYTVKEAMACNLPVVSTNVGDVSEYLTDVNPSIVAAESNIPDAIVKVLEAGHRSNGRKKAQNISMRRTGYRIQSIYEEVLET